jgi:hypothetical protein
VGALIIAPDENMLGDACDALHFHGMGCDGIPLKNTCGILEMFNG